MSIGVMKVAFVARIRLELVRSPGEVEHIWRHKKKMNKKDQKKDNLVYVCRCHERSLCSQNQAGAGGVKRT